MNALSLLDKDDDLSAYLVPLADNSPLCPQNVDKIKDLLKQMKNKDNTNTCSDSQNSERAFFRHFLRPHFKELSDSDGKIINEVHLVSAKDSSDRKEKALKLSQEVIDEINQDKMVPNLVLNDPCTPVSILTQCTEEEMPALLPEDSLGAMVVKCAQSEQLIQENGQQIFEEFCVLPQKEQLLVCNYVLRAMTKDLLKNVISYLSINSFWKTSDGLKYFIEKVVFNFMWRLDLNEENYSVLTLVLGFVSKDEDFMVEKFILPFMEKSNFANPETLKCITQMVVSIHKKDHRIAVLSTYLKYDTQKLSDENQIAFIEAVITSDTFNVLDDDVLLSSFCAYLLDSMHINQNNSPNFNKNTRLGKFLLKVMKKMPSEISSITYVNLSQIVNLHNSFLRKALSSELKKRNI